MPKYRARDAFHPEMLVSHSGLFEGAVLRRIEDLLAQVYPFKNDRDMTINDLCRIDDEKIIKALKKPGINKDRREIALEFVHTARKFAEPLGTRFPIQSYLMENYQEDGDYDNRPAVVARSMRFSDEHIMHLEKLLKEDGSELSRQILESQSDCFEDARRDSRVTLHVNRPVIHWQEGEHGYELRIRKHYGAYSSPTVNVIRRWDIVIQGVLVSIVRSQTRPGVGAYNILVNTDTDPEPLIYDCSSFLDAENALINKLNLRPTGLDAPDPKLTEASEKS